MAEAEPEGVRERMESPGLDEPLISRPQVGLWDHLSLTRCQEDATPPPQGLSSPYLGHQPVCPRVLLILEDNIRVVVGGQLFETLRAAGYFALGSPAGPQGLLGHVGAELLVGQRDELLGESPLAVAPARSAALRGRCEEEEEDQGAQRGGQTEGGDPHRSRADGGGLSPGERETSSGTWAGSGSPPRDYMVRGCRISISPRRTQAAARLRPEDRSRE